MIEAEKSFTITARVSVTYWVEADSVAEAIEKVRSGQYRDMECEHLELDDVVVEEDF